MTKVGFVGVGLMGHGMAKNLMKAGNDLTVIAHRNRAPVDDLVGVGAMESQTLAELSAASDVIFFCLSDSSVVEAVAAELKPDLRAGQIIVDATTARPQSTAALQEELKERGVDFVDAPITANPEKAELGQLTSLVGAADEVFRQVEPLIQSYSATVLHFGPTGMGHTAKLMNNFVTQATGQLLALSYSVARQAGVDWTKLHAAMSGGAAKSGTFEKMITPALEGDYRGHEFTLANSWKDIRYFAEFAESLGRKPTLVEGVLDSLEAVNDAGFGDRYVSEMLDPEVDAKLNA